VLGIILYEYNYISLTVRDIEGSDMSWVRGVRCVSYTGTMFDAHVWRKVAISYQVKLCSDTGLYRSVRANHSML